MRARQLGPLAQQRAVLDHHRVPAGGLEHRGEAAGGDVGDDAVQRLAVEVDDPHDLAQARDHRVRDRLPAGALVELGVADQRDLAAAARDVEVAGDVAVRERAPDRRGGAEADGPGGVVDRVGVLRPARVGLQPAVLAQRRQVAAVEAAEQVVDRVQDRARVRLDADRGPAPRGRRSTARSSGSPCCALEAWWPPTFTPERFSRTRLAWWTMLVASQSTRCSTRLSVSRSSSVATAIGWEVIR